MSAKLIDKNGNSDPLTDLEFIAAQSTVVKIREKKFTEDARATAAQVKEQAKTDAKIAEMKAREAIKIEREERRAAAKAQAAESWKEHQRTQREEKKEAEREAVKIRERERKQREKSRVKTAALTTAEKAVVRQERIERDGKKTGAIGEARDARLKDRERREMERGIAGDLKADEKLFEVISMYQQQKREVETRGSGRFHTPANPAIVEFLDWKSVETLDRIVAGCPELLGENNPDLEPLGLAVVDDGEGLAVACDHLDIMGRLGCGEGYHVALMGCPNMIDTSRAVWFGDRLERCIVFSLPIESGAAEKNSK